MGAKLGINAKMYYKVGAHAAWAGIAGLSELGNCRNVDLNISKGEADLTVRNNNGFKCYVGTLKEGQVDFEMVWDDSDAGFNAIAAAYFEGESDPAKAVSLAVLTGSAVGSQGLWSAMTITNFSRSEPIDGAITAKVTAKCRYDAVPAAWVTVAA